MSRVVLAAALLLALCVSMSAQRGGMRGGGGARVGMARGAAPMGFARGPQVRPQFFGSRPQFFAQRPAFAARPRPAFAPRPRPAFAPQRRGGFTFGHINGGPFITTRGFGDRFDHRFHHHHRFFFGFPYYYGGYYGSPYYDDFSNPYSSFGPYSYDPAANTSSYTDLGNQLGELDAEVQQLRDENDELRSNLDQQRRPAAPASSIGTTSGNEPATVLVFRDGHRTEVQNYAIVGSTVWLLSSARATKVPLADLDLDQTVKANEDRGLSFQAPK
jgi:hypothetical protein